MDHYNSNDEKKGLQYLSSTGAWALAFGCSVGWGAFVMPGTTFLPVAGPVGSALGLGVGAFVMMLLGANYHYLMNQYSGSGGVYTYARECFGYDHGFVSAWFLILTYIAIIWANATALPLIARTVLGSTFQFGFDYYIAGFHIYAGEILLAVLSLLLSALICLHRRLSAGIQIIMAVLLLAGIVICFAASLRYSSSGGTAVFSPAFAPGEKPLGGVFTVFALSPWAYVGFESISHSTAEASFPVKHTFRILASAVFAAGLAYVFLVLLSVTALPQGCSSWPDYIRSLDAYSGVSSQPAFHAVSKALGRSGTRILGITALCGIFPGLIGNYIALSRLFCSMSEEGMLPGWFGKTDKDNVPKRAIISILVVSVILPFLGRTAISWIVDVTTVGATIAYAYASASALKTARLRKQRLYTVTGICGIAASILFVTLYLIPNLTRVKTLSRESYFILAAWGILGLLYFLRVFQLDKKRRYGHSVIVWAILFALIIFSSSIWMDQRTSQSIEDSVEPIQNFYTEKFADAGIDEDEEPGSAHLREVLEQVEHAHTRTSTVHVILVTAALLILFIIYYGIQKREKQAEIEKAIAEESNRAKTSFLSNMSHEIRTPMNAIIGLDNLALRNPNLQPKTREQLEKIGASARHLLGLINDILDMSRIESGRIVVKNEEFAFRDFLDQINIIINGQCQDKGLHYECNIIGHAADYYFGDDLKLKQILINILGNSVKFTDAPGDVSLTIEEINRFEGLCTIRFIVKDTGIGIDQEYIPKIFEAFSQENEGSANRYGSTGLGMAITKKYVDMMNGEISVESQKGVGSTFTVIVTLKASGRAVQLEGGISVPQDLRTIVVDDDEIACEHGLLVLRSLGINADMATDSGEALRLIREAKERGDAYELLLTDYKMPGMNGLELTKAVREFDEGRTAVIMLTGYNWDSIEEEAEACQIDGMVSKPLFSDNLMRTINAALKSRGRDSALLPEGQDAPSRGQDVPAGEEDEQVLSRHDSSVGALDAHAVEEESILAGRRVLIAEDVEQNAEILEDLLELEDISYEHAVNGEIAVNMFLEKPEGYFDAILMDVRMPVMDGLTATHKIRSLDRSDAKTIPIIAMTANVFDEDVERSLQAGMNAHLSKPVEPEHMFETLAKLIAAGQK